MTIPRKASILAAAAVLCAAAALPALAQYDDFSGGIRIGYRAVDVSGNDNKYREDIDLDDGPRLFELSFHFVPQEGDAAKQMVDRINLDVNNFGGDPFETLSLGVQRFDRFEFRYNRSKSEYFYNDTLGTLPDLHGFDFERVRDHASLDLDLTKRATFTFGFDRFTKTGNSTTTLDVQRDEFEFDKPIDESLNDYQVGFSYAWNEVTLTVEEQVRDYQNLYEIFLPGQSQGEDAEDSAVLDFFFLDQPYDYSANTHVARIVATPGKWIVRGQVMLQDLDLDVSATERSGGTSFGGSPFTTNVNGRGQVNRQMDLFDLDLTYALNDRFAIIGGAYSRSLDQDGDFLFGDELNRGKWKIDTTGFEGGVEVVATDSITLSGGVRVESRDVDRGVLEGGEPGEGIDETESHSTDQTGFFGTFAYRPAGSAFRLTAEVDDSSYDDPFTETSPTDRLRWRVRGDYGLGHGFSVAALLPQPHLRQQRLGLGFVLRPGHPAPRLQRSEAVGVVGLRPGRRRAAHRQEPARRQQPDRPAGDLLRDQHRLRRRPAALVGHLDLGGGRQLPLLRQQRHLRPHPRRRPCLRRLRLPHRLHRGGGVPHGELQRGRQRPRRLRRGHPRAVGGLPLVASR